MTVICDKCKAPVAKEKLLFTWNTTSNTDVIEAIRILHALDCDDKYFLWSDGPGVEEDWDANEQLEFFSSRQFVNPDDQRRVLEVIKYISHQ